MKPLERIKVLDLSRVAPHAYCTMILADLGAAVIKIEVPFEPGATIVGSGVSPHPQDEQGERVAAFNPFNRNKKSITLNLKMEESREILGKLVKRADVMVEGFRPGVAKRLGVDYKTLSKINPRLIYCSITGYGQDGPYKDLPGHDPNYIGFAGALGLIGTRDSPPVMPLNLVADYAGGTLHGVIGILAALSAREKSGKGQYVDIAMVDGVISLMSLIAANYFRDDIIPRHGEGMFAGDSPFINVYETKDGKYITIACAEHHLWENLCRTLGREDFIPYQRFTSQHEQYAESEKEKEILFSLREIFLNKTRDEWFEELKDKNICVGKVYDVDEVFTDPQVLHRKMMVEVPHPKLGKVKQVGIPIKLSDTPGEIRDTSPFLGQHTEEVLLDLGYNKRQIEGLRGKGVI